MCQSSKSLSLLLSDGKVELSSALVLWTIVSNRYNTCVKLLEHWTNVLPNLMGVAGDTRVMSNRELEMDSGSVLLLLP